jgi:hypothetical protein
VLCAFVLHHCATIQCTATDCICMLAMHFALLRVQLALLHQPKVSGLAVTCCSKSSYVTLVSISNLVCRPRLALAIILQTCKYPILIISKNVLTIPVRIPDTIAQTSTTMAKQHVLCSIVSSAISE